MNPQAQATSTEQSRARSSRFARSASAAGALAVLAVNGLGCGTELGGPANDEDATASIASALDTNPWPTDWTSSSGQGTVKDDAGFLAIHYDGYTSRGGGINRATYQYMAKAPAYADLIFKWDYSGDHGTNAASVRLTAFADGPNGDHKEIVLVGTTGNQQPVSGAFGFSNKRETALRVYAGYTYGFVVEGADRNVPPIFQGDLNVQYRAEKIVKSEQFGGQPWPAGGGFTNIERIAPPGAYINNVTVVWSGDAIVGLSWTYQDAPADACTSGQCAVGKSSFNGGGSGNIPFASTDRLGPCTIVKSPYGYGSVKQLEFKKHPAMDATRTTIFTFGKPDSSDDKRVTETDGDFLVGFYGAYNNDGFFASIGLITRKPQ